MEYFTRSPVVKGRLILFYFFLATAASFSQNNEPTISNVTYDEYEGKAVLKDEQGRNYPITIYMSLFERSEMFYAYSVKGWYYYDRHKIKIPLVGILDNNGLVLFHFENEAKSNEILFVNDNSWNDWEWREFIDKRKRMSGFMEKFDFSNETWLSGSKSLKFISHYKHELTRDEEYLKFNYKDSVLLPLYHRQYQILAQNELKFILKYSHPSKKDQLEGWCHLGYEEGFLEVKIRDDLSIESRDFSIESCLQSVYTITSCQKATQLTGRGEQIRDIMFYQLESGWENSSSVLMVDLDECIIHAYYTSDD